MGNLTKTATKVCCVISDKSKSINVSLLEKWLKDNCKDYSFIAHDKDVDETGYNVTFHYHCVFTLKKQKIRLSTTLNSLSNFLGCSSFAISIDKCDNYGLSLQYLVHRNHQDKFQYDLKDVVSSLPFEELSMVLTETSDVLNFDVLKTICAESFGSRMYIMSKIGIGYYSKYRNVINDILGEIDYSTSRFNSLK